MSAHDIDAIKHALSLIDLVQRDGHALHRSGTKQRMLCPFHEEKTPSCFVDGLRFHCFGCGADGDVFEYIKRRDGCDFGEALRKAADMAGIAINTASTRSIPHQTSPQPWKPYRMSEAEREQCAAMADALARNERAIHAVADSRGWRPETIRTLALDSSLGMHDGKLVHLYPTGAKKRFKPLRPALEATHTGPKFAWMFGKPDAPWLSHLLTPATGTLHITEGETSAIEIINMGDGFPWAEEGVIAVPGASGWRDEWAVLLDGMDVIIWPDADPAGEQLRERIIRSITPFAESIACARVPGVEKTM